MRTCGALALRSPGSEPSLAHGRRRLLSAPDLEPRRRRDWSPRLHPLADRGFARCHASSQHRPPRTVALSDSEVNNIVYEVHAK
eukprot:6190552-Pleurochrysis_carterae.AAC.5